MAFIRFKDQTCRFMPQDKALDIWRVKRGKMPATAKQQAYCETVQEVYLNWRTAPADYVEEHKQHIYDPEPISKASKGEDYGRDNQWWQTSSANE